MSHLLAFDVTDLYYYAKMLIRHFLLGIIVMTADNWYVVGVKCSYGQLGEHYIFTVITSKYAHNFTISLIKILIIVYNM